MGGFSRHRPTTPPTSEASTDEQILMLPIALGEGFVASQLTLDGLKLGGCNDGRDRDLDPFLPWSVDSPRFPSRFPLVVINPTSIAFIPMFKGSGKER
jgi:hypothetical protein